MRQASRSHENIRQAFVNYFSSREGVRSKPEDSLPVQHSPLESASFERSSDLRLDAERGLGCQLIPFEDKLITFLALTGYAAGAANSGNREAREFVGRRWGMSAGRVGKISERTIDLMVRHLSKRCPCR